MQAIYTMYVIPLIDSFKQVHTVFVRLFSIYTYIVLHMGPRPLMQINILTQRDIWIQHN